MPLVPGNDIVENSVESLVLLPLGLGESGSTNAPRHEIFAHAMHTERDLRAHGVFRNAKFLSDCAVREAMKLAQGEYLTAAFGQGAKGFG